VQGATIDAVSTDGGRRYERRRYEGLSWEVVLSAVPDALLVIDQGSRVVFANAAAKRLFDRSESSLLGTHAFELVTEQDADLFAELRAKALKAPALGPTGHRAELSIRGPDGASTPIELDLGKAGGSGGEPLVICSFRDVAGRHDARERQVQLEMLLNRSRRLEAVGRVAGGVAHDFNNLLAVILNYATFVAEELPPGSSMLKDLDEVRTAAERGTSLTRQLLIFSGRDLTHPEILDLNATIRRLEKMLRRTVGSHIELNIALAPDLSVVEIDPAEIEQAILNLVLNARDAMPGGGVLTIESENVELDEIYTGTVPGMDPGAYVRVTVADSGPGIAPADLEHIFEPFYTTKPPAEGTGLGLAAVHGIIGAAGGHVGVYSEPGIGTAFKIHLPIAAGVPVEPSEFEIGEHTWRTGTVLVVEDEPSVLVMASRILERAGNAVLSAADGPSALEILAARGDDVDLVLADVVMPRMLGPELAKRIARDRPGLPVVFMSGYTHQKIAAQALLRGEVVLIEKPFTAARLVNAVGAALSAASAETG
jgi:two-component system cell cycle sensor histidine kinase/response regulator CckA